MKSKKIGVLMGGSSPERDISLISGSAVLDALKRKGYNASGIDVDNRLDEKLRLEEIDVVFIVLHGSGGEDGTVQGLLETLGVPYTGSSVQASVLGMNKRLTKILLNNANIPTPAFCCASSLEELMELLDAKIEFPLVVKPARGGSTLGISVVKEAIKLLPAFGDALQFDDCVVLESFVAGREISVGVLDNSPLPVIEMLPKDGFYNYEAKYTEGMTQYVVPAELDKGLYLQMQNLALDVYGLLGCSGVARVDFRLSTDNRPYVLEINTIPGMAPTSLLPKVAASAGIDYDSLVERMLLSAIKG